MAMRFWKALGAALIPDSIKSNTALAHEISYLLADGYVDEAIQKFRKASNDDRYAILMDRDVRVLHIAAMNGHVDTITAMLDGLSSDRRLAAITVRNRGGNTPLYVAAQFGHAGAISAMLDGLSPDQRLAAIMAPARDEYTPLHVAAFNGHADAITPLLDGLSPDRRLKAITVRDRGGDTPLYVAAQRSSVGAITPLLSGLDAAQCADALFDSEHGAAIKLAHKYVNNLQDARALNTLIKGVAALNLSGDDKKGLITGILEKVTEINPQTEIPSAAAEYLDIPKTVGGYLQELQGPFAQAAIATTADPANGNDHTSEATIGNAGGYKHGVKRGFDGNPVSRGKYPGCDR